MPLRRSAPASLLHLSSAQSPLRNTMDVNAEDSVLVGVIKRKRDLEFARIARWYRIPEAQMPYGIHAKVLGFFLNASMRGADEGAVSFYAEVRGYELALRRDLLPDEPQRADERYYRIALGEVVSKTPPIVNKPPRTITFVQTTWDRFSAAATIADLYSTDDAFVDRIYHALKKRGVVPQRSWEVERAHDADAPALRIACNNGVQIVATPRGGDDPQHLHLNQNERIDHILREIFARIDQNDGLVSVSLPSE